MDQFSTNLRARITSLGLTHAEVARRCDLELRRFHHYVVGDREPDLVTLVRIASVLDTTVDELLNSKSASKRPVDAASQLRSRISAALLTFDAQSLRLVARLVDSLVAHEREGDQSSPIASRKRPAKTTTERKI